jgi:hypothetical protein
VFYFYFVPCGSGYTVVWSRNKLSVSSSSSQ